MATQAQAQAQIDKALQRIRAAGKKSGQAKGPVKEVGFGGWSREYERLVIYWHPIMGSNGAHEVHGDILARFVALGGPGRIPGTSQRPLGFPMSDELRTPDGRPVTHFEWGSIYAVRDAGAVALYKPFHAPWKNAGAEAGPLGYPLVEPTQVAEGHAVFFERGSYFKGPSTGNQILEFRLRPPLMGRPMFVSADGSARIPALITVDVPSTIRAKIKSERPSLFSQVWQDRLFLRPVLAPGSRISRTSVVALKTRKSDEVATSSGGARVTLQADSERPLKNRTLYDLCIKRPDGKILTLAPNSVYARDHWEDFGFAHITDLHISGRVDTFRKKLANKGKASGSREYSNFNDNFRTFIRYANHLHAIGALDVVLATGDLVDYVFERSDNRNGGGNFELLEKIILGKSRSSDGSSVERLRLPILLTPGNHDYRSEPYELIARVDAGDFGVFDLLPGGIGDRTFPNFASHGLTEDEALAIQNEKTPKLDMPTAAKVVKPLKSLPTFYHKRLGTEASYAVRLGSHTFLMLNTRQDLGVLNSGPKDVFNLIIKNLNEEERDFVGGSPDQMGVSLDDLKLLKRELNRGSADGVFIIGMHGSPINPAGSEFAHYFRETEHASLDPKKGQVAAFLRRHARLPIGADPKLWPMWPTHGTKHFKEGLVKELLDYGTSRGKVDEFLRMCAGDPRDGVKRAADVVLSGHGHRNVEYRIRSHPSKKLLYYMDFYTSNPPNYYTSKNSSNDAVHIRVKEGAPLNGSPVSVRDHGSGKKFKHLDVPPYSSPLNSNTNAKTWWNAHRPLVMQTAGLGATESTQRDLLKWTLTIRAGFSLIKKTLESSKEFNPEQEYLGASSFKVTAKREDPTVRGPSFQGFRVFEVRENLINQAHYVTLAELRRNNFRMPWELRER